MKITAHIEGGLYGWLWGGCDGFKPVERRVHGNLVTAVRELCKDGDFEHARLTPDSQIVLTLDSVSGRSFTRRQKYYSVTEFPSIAEFVSDKELPDWAE